MLIFDLQLWTSIANVWKGQHAPWHVVALPETLGSISAVPVLNSRIVIDLHSFLGLHSNEKRYRW